MKEGGDDIAHLRVELGRLWASAEPKRWAAEPTTTADAAGYLFSACIENGYFVLGVSPVDPRVEIIAPGVLFDLLAEMFGPPYHTVQREYPKRGTTTLLLWRAQ